MLKEAVLGGGTGARAGIVHENQMGGAFRLVRLVYSLDGTEIFSRADDGNGSLYKQTSIDVLTGPIAPGSHTLSVLAEYHGHGYGVFNYMNQYTFKVRGSHTFMAAEGKATSLHVIAHEKGGVSTPVDQKPTLDFRVSIAEGAAAK
jgi:hypothetical protein